MKARVILGLLFWSIFCSYNFAQEVEMFKKLSAISVMTSTRADIINLLGEPADSQSPYFVEYELKEGSIDIEYSQGRCSNERKSGWDVSEFTVTRVFLLLIGQTDPKSCRLAQLNFVSLP